MVKLTITSILTTNSFSRFKAYFNYEFIWGHGKLLVDFAIGLVNSVFNLQDGQLMFFEEFERQKNCEINSACQKSFGASSIDACASKC